MNHIFNENTVDLGYKVSVPIFEISSYNRYLYSWGACTYGVLLIMHVYGIAVATVAVFILHI